jgi:hypothetical protein
VDFDDILLFKTDIQRSQSLIVIPEENFPVVNKVLFVLLVKHDSTKAISCFKNKLIHFGDLMYNYAAAWTGEAWRLARVLVKLEESKHLHADSYSSGLLSNHHVCLVWGTE